MMRFVSLFLLFCIGGCAILPGGSKSAARGSVYLIDANIPVAATTAPAGCHVVVVQPPVSAPGQIGWQMLYQREPHKIERFAYSRWAASPAAMLDALLQDALRTDGRYAAVLSMPASILADLRVENDDLWLIQHFDGDKSHVELRMTSRVVAPELRKLLASRSFSYEEPAAEATAGAGVAAADRAVRRLLEDFRSFVAAAADTLNKQCEESD